MNLQKYIKLIIICLCWATPAYAYDKSNVRTQCRSLIAGHYLTKLNARDRLQEYVDLLNGQNKKFSKKLKQLNQELSKLEAEVAAKEFDVALARNRDGLAFQIKTMTNQIEESSKDLVHYAEDLSEQSAELENLKSKIEKVFDFVTDATVAGGGYGFRIMFKTDCPKYRYICTLPPKEARDLLDIKVDGEVPEPCRRYFNLSQVEY